MGTCFMFQKSLNGFYGGQQFVPLLSAVFITNAFKNSSNLFHSNNNNKNILNNKEMLHKAYNLKVKF